MIIVKKQIEPDNFHAPARRVNNRQVIKTCNEFVSLVSDYS
jgi:hypothetical protein